MQELGSIGSKGAYLRFLTLTVVSCYNYLHHMLVFHLHGCLVILLQYRLSVGLLSTHRQMNVCCLLLVLSTNGKTLVSFLTGSGWTEMLTAAGITTAGTAES